MDRENLDELNLRRDMRNRENVALAGLGIRTSADIFEAAERQLEEARSWKAPPRARPADTSALASLGIRTSADMWEATQKQQEEAREKKSSRQQRGRKSRESGSVERQPRSLEGRPGNNQPAGPGASFRSVQIDGGRRVPLAPRPSVGSLAGPASEEEAHNQPNTVTFAGPDFRPSAEMLEAGRRSLVAALGLRTVADISEESRNENFRQRRRTRTVESFSQVATGGVEDAAEDGAPPAGPSGRPGRKRAGSGRSDDQPAPKRKRAAARRERDEEEQAGDLASILGALDEEFAEKERLSYGQEW
ncbi:hypothetical protein NW759_017556, partial [Fusarium solani]